ncbi:PDGLE domain-containing protein [Yimella sp. cx-573]|nr:PDGLE domain-containing protein [Yimella sp. cx-573]
MNTQTPRRISTRTVVLVGALVSAVLAGLVSFYASSHPDGLEFVAEKLGFDSEAADSHTADSPLADYAVSGVADPRVSGGLAGLAGLVVVALVMGALVWLLRRGRSTSGERHDRDDAGK